MATSDFIPTHQLLDASIESLSENKPLNTFALRQAYPTLRHLLGHSLDELLAMPGFSTECCDELIELLQRHQRLYLLRITSPR